MDAKERAKYIDHTILKAEAGEEDVKKVCDEAKKYNFASVCVNSCFAAFVNRELKGTGITTCVVVGFPLGAMSTKAKAFEAAQAVRDGAGEIDMVINIGAVKDGRMDYVESDIREVVEASAPAKVKVIIECCLLSDEEKVKACEAAVSAGAAFVKTSTGFSLSGAKAEDVKLMKKTVGERAKIKAAGGIRTLSDFNEMIAAGADRIGCSKGVQIVSE